MTIPPNQPESPPTLNATLSDEVLGCPAQPQASEESDTRDTTLASSSVAPPSSPGSGTLTEALPPTTSATEVLSGDSAIAQTRVMEGGDHSAGPWPMESVAGYEILVELGRGGMGVVYRARQQGLNRLVALKRILTGGRASASELLRFRAETEAIASLRHPNIVQIYEVGEHDGQPFCALELVEGGSLQDRLARQPLSARLAARLIHVLAGAMHVVHQQGLIHRDLKPANVLLDGPPAAPLEQCIPKITDFGLAKRLEGDSSQTRDGAVLGTPAYMAPEQAEGRVRDVGPAADVHALGAMLYEMLTGRPPFRAETVMDTLHQVIHADPLPPRQLQLNVPRDLQTICLKCLAKEPSRRYASAGALADDLGRFLRGEPILARPTPVWERLWKWIRRRPAAAALLAVSVLFPLILAAGGLWYAQRERSLREVAQDQEREANRQRAAAEREQREANRQRKAAQDQEREAKREHGRAEKNLQQARDAVDHLTELGHRRLAKYPQMELVRRELLELSLSFHQRFLRINGDDPGQRWQVARAQLRAGEIQEMLGKTQPAEASYRAAVQLLDKLAASFPQQRDYRRELAASWNDLAILLEATKRPQQAEEAFGKALALKHELVAKDGTPEDRRKLANSYNGRGQFHHTRKESKKAEDDYQTALRWLETTDASLKRQWQPDRARTWLNLATLWTTTRPEKAEQPYAEALKLWQDLQKRHPEEPSYQQKVAEVHLNCGTYLHLRKRADEAEKHYEEAARLLARLVERFPSVPDHRQLLVSAWNNLGQLLRDSKRPHEAAAVWQRLVEACNGLVQMFPETLDYQAKLGRGYNELGIALAMSNKLRPAEAAWREALAVQEKLVGRGATEPIYWRDLLESQENLTRLLRAVSPSKEAEQACRQWVATQRRRLARFPRRAEMVEQWGGACLVLADLLKDRNKPGEAAEFLLRSLSLLGKTPGLSESRRKQWQKLYGDRALPLLSQAVKAGMIEMQRLRTDSLFDSLRNREAFQKLLGGD